MKTIFITLAFALSSLSFAQTPLRLDCQEGNLRLSADLVSKRVDLLELDEFTGREISRFGFAQRISKHHLYLMRFQTPYYLFVMNIKGDGLIKGRFESHLESAGVREGSVTYEGSFAWEPLHFSKCFLR